MGSPLGLTLSSAFLCFYETKWLENSFLNLNQFFIDMLMCLFYSNQPITSKNFVTTLILATGTCHFRLSKKKIVKYPF